MKPKIWLQQHNHDEPVPSTVGLNLPICVGLRSTTVLPGRYANMLPQLTYFRWVEPREANFPLLTDVRYRNSGNHGTSTTCLILPVRPAVSHQLRAERHSSSRSGQPSRKPEVTTASMFPRRSGCDYFHDDFNPLSIFPPSTLPPTMVPSKPLVVVRACRHPR